MWVPGYYRFASRAAYLAACEAAGWPLQVGEPAPPAGVALDAIGAHIAPPAIVDGHAQPGEVLDARYHVNAAWHGVEPPDSFTDAAISPATPARGFDLPPAAAPMPPAVPLRVDGWKGRQILAEAGLLANARSLAQTAGARVARALDEATVWNRDSQFVATMAAALNLTDEQVDQMFRDADAIQS